MNAHFACRRTVRARAPGDYRESRSIAVGKALVPRLVACEDIHATKTGIEVFTGHARSERANVSDERDMRYRSFRNTERTRFGVERVRRIDVYPYGEPPRDEDGEPLSLRDRVIREMVRRCEHRGAANFFLGLRPNDDPAQAVRTVLALSPVVAAVLVIDGARLTDEVLDGLNAESDQGEVWIELPYRPHDVEAFTAAVKRVRSAGLHPIARAMSGPAGDANAGFRDLATVARDLRLRVVHALPWQRLAAPPDYDAEPVTPASIAASPDVRAPARDEYLAVLADLIERLPTATAVDIRGRAGPDDAILDPDWVRGPSLGPDLNALLRERQTRQGHHE